MLIKKRIIISKTHNFVSFFLFSTIFLVLLYIFSSISFSKIGPKNPLNEVEPGNYGNPPLMKGIIFSSFRDNKQPFVFRAAEMSIRRQRLEDITFGSLKEVAITHVEIFAQINNISEVMNWSMDDNLEGLLFPMYSAFSKKCDYSLFGLRIVIENLKVFTHYENDKPQLVMTADSVVLDPFSSEISFSGHFRLSASPSENYYSDGNAKWISLSNAFFFPEGFYCNGKYQRPGAIQLLTQQTKALEILTHSDDQNLKDLTPTINIASTSSSMFSSKSSTFPQMRISEIDKLIKTNNIKQVRSHLWQLLAINPSIFKRQGIANMLIMGPNPKLGEFKPSFLHY